MENASKALIIAGAILLSILIISLGIFIFNQASEITKSSNLSEVEVLNFNEKFTSFEGTNVRGSEVNSLLNRIVQNNVANQIDESKKVKLTQAGQGWQSGETSTNTAPNTMPKKAQTGKTYNVTYTIDANTGLVNLITITSN
jgi:hypothetical protein